MTKKILISRSKSGDCKYTENHLASTALKEKRIVGMQNKNTSEYFNLNI